jgi:phosphate:Na+ symporter
LVILASLNIHLVVIYLLGLAGLSCYFEKPAKFTALAGALLGIALLFFGLETMQAGAAPLQEQAWLKDFLRKTQTSYMLAFVAGALLTIVVQSSAAVSVIAIAMAETKLLGLEQALMIVYGTNLGDSIATYLLSASLKGTMKQIALFQSLFNVVGSVIFVALFYIETGLGVPLVMAGLDALTPSVAKKSAYAYLLFNGVTSLVLALVMTPWARMLARLAPETAEESESRLKFIHPRAAEDPESALELVNQEQLRLLHRLPSFMERLRGQAPSASSEANIAAHTAFRAVSAEVHNFLTELMERPHGHQTAERVLAALNRQNLIAALGENTFLFSQAFTRAHISPKLQALALSLLEGLDTLFLTAIEAWQGSEIDNQMLAESTSDRGDQMKKLRDSYLTREAQLDTQDRSLLFTVTNQFERLVWLLNGMPKLIGASK